MSTLPSTKTPQKDNLVSSAQIKAILKDQIQLNCLCIGQLSLKEFLSFQGWLPPNTTDFLNPHNPQWLMEPKKQKQERARLEWSNSLAVARLKSMVKNKINS